MKALFSNKVVLAVIAVLLVTAIGITAFALIPDKEKPNPGPGEDTTPIESQDPAGLDSTDNIDTTDPADPDAPDNPPSTGEISDPGPSPDEAGEDPVIIDSTGETKSPTAEAGDAKDGSADPEPGNTPDDDNVAPDTKPSEPATPSGNEQNAEEKDEKHEIPADDKEKPVVAGEEDKSTDDTQKPDVIVGEENPGGPVFVPPTGGDNPFDDGNAPIIDEKPVDGYIDPGEGGPGEGVHF